MLPEVYVSIDIEADGPVPGLNSMLSLGAVAYFEDGTEVGRFYKTIMPMKEASPNGKTMEWWATQPEAWEEVNKDRRPPAEVMNQFNDWLKLLPGLPVFVAYPVAFDVMFVYWYMQRFLGNCPIGFRAIDVRSFLMGLTGRGYNKTHKGDLPGALKPHGKHTHRAIDDAEEQGEWFIRLLKMSKEKNK